MKFQTTKFKSAYRVSSPTHERSFLCDLVVSDERCVEIIQEESQHKPVVNAFAGARDGGKRGLATPFEGQGVCVNGRNAVFVDGNSKRAVVKFAEGTEVINRADISEIDYPRGAEARQARWTDEDGSVHDRARLAGGVVLKSRDKMLTEPRGYHWTPSWLCACQDPCACGWDLITNSAIEMQRLPTFRRTA
jgi:hypothetical protein